MKSSCKGESVYDEEAKKSIIPDHHFPCTSYRRIHCRYAGGTAADRADSPVSDPLFYHRI